MFDSHVLDSIRNCLTAKGETLSVAESVTSGMLQLALSEAEKASAFYQGGITAYNLGQKYRHLNVEPIHAQSTNCVSQKVAEQMALAVCPMFRSDWGVGITGYATPVPESGNQVFAYYAIALRGNIVTAGRLDTAVDKPTQVQRFFVKQLLQQLDSYIQVHYC
jgi:PncC family amidohydrolase